MPAADALITVVTATLAGGQRGNQDHILVTPSAVAVLDGASSFGSAEHELDGGWYARTLGAALREPLMRGTGSLAEIVQQAIETVQSRFELIPGESPSSTVTIARWDDVTLELYALGDSPGVIFPRNGEPVVVHDDRIEQVGADERDAYRTHLRESRGYGPELTEMLVKVQRAERLHRNRDGGYWVAEASPDAAHMGITRSLPVSSAGAVLLVSDGLSACVTDYGTHTWPTLLGALATSTGQALAAVHRTEDVDCEGRQWPRSKVHDDKSAVVVTWDCG